MSEVRWGDICNRVDTCALTGAAAMAAGIAGAEVLSNGPLWCYFYALRHLEHAQYKMAERFHGSQPDNNAVVYGAEKYVTEALEHIVQKGSRPALLFIESSCSMSLIGDDLSGIARKMQLPFPVVTMDCGGMLGGFAEGYSKACIKILQQFVDKNAVSKNNTVNLLGLSEFYLHGAGDIREICRLLRKAGYTVQCVPGGGSTLEEIVKLKQAAVNIVCHEELGLPVAKFLQEHYGMPFVLAGLPYGIDGTMQWLGKVREALPCVSLAEVQTEAEALHSQLNFWNNDNRCLWGSLWFDAAIVSAPATVALCMAQALRSEWADMGRLTVVCQQQLKQQQYCDVADEVYFAGIDAEAIGHCLQTQEAVLLLGSSSESSVLRRSKNTSFVSCNIAFPANDEAFLLEQPSVGLEGCKYMQQRLWNGFIRQRLQRAGEK